MRILSCLLVVGLLCPFVGCDGKSASATAPPGADLAASENADASADVGGGGAPQARGFCSETSLLAVEACDFEAKAGYALARGRCLGLTDEDEASECFDIAREEYDDARQVCKEQRHFRREICDEVGEEVYAPDIDPERFVEVIDNHFLPLLPGTTWIYESESEEGLETIEVTVTSEKKEILGVACTVVRDTVKLEGVLVEDTFDYFAQDVDGNVWYFGEISFNYEDGEVVDLAGSWQAGVDSAQPGILMFAEPELDVLYRQEYLLGEAEDMARVVAFDEVVSVPYGDFSGCLQSAEIVPLEPDVLEYKFYAPGIGFVLALDAETGEGERLISLTLPEEPRDEDGAEGE